MHAFSRQAWRASAPLGVLAFWCGLWIAGERYPSEYDWRYMTISSLLYPDRDPDGYRWARGGVALCGVGGLCWVATLVWNRRRAPATDWPVGIWAMGLGYVCMAGCASLPSQFLQIPRSHDILALSAFIALCIGVVHLTYRVVVHGLRRRARSVPGGSRIYACIVAGAAVLPLVLVSITQTYVSHALPQLPWVGIEWRERGVPAYLSFAFWEWAACAVFSAYTVALSILSGASMKPTT